MAEPPSARLFFALMLLKGNALHRVLDWHSLPQLAKQMGHLFHKPIFRRLVIFGYWWSGEHPRLLVIALVSRRWGADFFGRIMGHDPSLADPNEYSETRRALIRVIFSGASPRTF